VPRVKLAYDLWHLAFANLMQHRAPPNFEVQTEVRLTIEPQRADMLLLRRLNEANRDDEAKLLRWLWHRLGRVTIVEFKSPVDSPFRPGDLLRLVGYGFLYDTAHIKELPAPSDLTLVLVIASITGVLQAEIERMGWTLVPLANGYSRIEGVVYSLYVAETDAVCDAEKDEYLRLFSRLRAQQGEATKWLSQWMAEKKMKEPEIEGQPDYEQMFQKMVEALPAEKRLAGLTPEERLAGLAPEQRLAGLAPEHLTLALPVTLLRTLSEDYLALLPPAVREEIRRRIRQARD
jgi:hypothetical protein